MQHKRGKCALALLLAGVLCFGHGSIQVKADDISDAQQKASELEQQKEAATKQKEELAAQLNQIVQEMAETEAQITKKRQEIEKTDTELIEAQLKESKQYDDMKLRIRFMYEQGDMNFLQILFESDSIGEFLNKAEYIQKISRYDRDMLEQFEQSRREVEEKEAQLQKEEEELNKLQTTLLQKKDQVQKTLDETNTKISDLEQQIGDNASRLQSLIRQAEEARRVQQEAANSGSGGSGAQAGPAHVSGSGRLGAPLASLYITSGYGNRDQPVAGATTWHPALDFRAAVGTPIYASEAGRVVTAKFNAARGYYVVIDHGNGLSTLYQHCDRLYVSVGQQVSKGQNIAAAGATGYISGPHLHYEVWVNGSPVNPAPYLGL